MINLSIDEIKRNSDDFIKRHINDSDERRESQIFWRDFLDIFNVDVKDVATYEYAVKKFEGTDGFIDLFWKGKLLIEHKSKKKNLDSAFNQALGYLDTLSAQEKPDYIIVSDFQRIRLIEFTTGTTNEFELKDLTKNIQLFDFIYNDNKPIHTKQEKLNEKATELLCELHDALKESNYDQHELQVFIIRILFCLYSEDTGIFNQDQFKEYIYGENPEDIDMKLERLFGILDKPYDKRQTNISDELKAFPYVNGKLFSEHINAPTFDKKMYYMLLNVCDFDWSEISPAIFGSLFQSVMDPIEQREFGAHYTSESNILKVINSLFLNDLWKEFKKCNKNKKKLEELLDKISNLKFLDPACGCGNFLIVTYRELRLLENEINRILFGFNKYDKYKPTQISVDHLTKIKIENFYGIELEEFPSRIAQVAMWFVEHQMNLESERILEFHEDNLPLKHSVNIINDNALKLDWKEILKPSNNVYIMGNPPFVGKTEQTKQQKQEMKQIFRNVKSSGELDYVSSWYLKASEYIQNTTISVAFVSTNSICQGIQVGILWKELLVNYNIHINFAHTTFKWNNESKGKAAVYVVIIGFSTTDKLNKYLFTYEDINSNPVGLKVKEINQYLTEGKIVFIESRQYPLSSSHFIKQGSKKLDFRNLTLNEKEKRMILKENPEVEKYIRQLMNASDFLKNKREYCLWFKDISPSELSNLPMNIKNRINNVRERRENSNDKGVQKLAKTPWLFQIHQPKNNFLVIPRTTTENRDYIPIGFLNKNIIITDALFSLENATLYDFGLLTSKMHMTWVKYVCGRLKGDFRYSNEIVYNNYPFPKNPTDKQINNISDKSQKVLDVRKKYPDESLDKLYSKYMPSDLRTAHDKLDESVDKLYSNKKFKTEEQRMKLLFELYEKYTYDNQINL